MKKTLILLSVLAFTVAATTAQEISDNAIGLRIGGNTGFGTEISYQRAIFDSNRLEFGLGLRNASNFSAFRVSGVYQWVWLLDGNFNWYAGAGASIGSFNLDDNFPNRNDFNTLFINAAGNIGIEYNFDFPLLLSLDFRPELSIINDIDNSLEFQVALGARYQW